MQRERNRIYVNTVRCGICRYAAEIGMQGFKIASCDLTNLPFLKHLAAKKLPILLSTGASTIDEIKSAVDVIEQEGNRAICIMQCTLCYPTENKDAHLAALRDIERHFPDYVLGLSTTLWYDNSRCIHTLWSEGD